MGTFEEFYAQHYGPVRAYAARRFGDANAEDIAQETMLRALGHLPELTDGRPAMPWLRTVAARIGVDGLRRQRSEAMEHDELVALSPSVPDETTEVAMRVDVGGLLHRAMRKLSAGDRQALAMREIYGLAVSDIADLTGSNANSVRQRLFRARTNLSRYYREIGGGAYSVPPVVRGPRRVLWRAATRVNDPVLETPARRILGGAATAVVAVVIGTTLTAPPVPLVTRPAPEAAEPVTHDTGPGAATVRKVADVAKALPAVVPPNLTGALTYDESWRTGLLGWEVAGRSARTTCDTLPVRCYLLLQPRDSVSVGRAQDFAVASTSLLRIGLYPDGDSDTDIEVSLGTATITVATVTTGDSGRVTVRSSATAKTASLTYVPGAWTELWLRLDRNAGSVRVAQAANRGPLASADLAVGAPFAGVDRLTIRARKPATGTGDVRVTDVLFAPTSGCYNGADDDEDGLTDLADAGCTDVFDDDEGPTECEDGIDNDGDGAIDYPADPSCLWREGPEVTACSNGVDDDADGRADYPEDTDCPGAYGVDEVAECSDGVDSDSDVAIDYPADLGCTGPGDDSEVGCVVAAVDSRGTPLAQQVPNGVRRTGACLDPVRVVGTFGFVAQADPRIVRGYVEEYDLAGTSLLCVTLRDGGTATSPCAAIGATFVRHVGALLQADAEPGLEAGPGVRVCTANVLLIARDTSQSPTDSRDDEQAVTIC